MYVRMYVDIISFTSNRCSSNDKRLTNAVICSKKLIQMDTNA